MNIRKKLPVLYIVIPCYNEQAVLPMTAPMFQRELALLIDDSKISSSSRILFVNDGSSDRTWDIICDLSRDSEFYRGISLSRNRGHQNALLAGLMEAKNYADITISIDCDGQDDIAVMGDMVDAYLDGCEVVYGVRSRRDTDTYFKKTSARFFYRMMKGLGAEIVADHADYRLLSKRVLDELSNYEEVNIFLRGMIPLVGFKSTSVYYERHERIAGNSHYPLRKMLSLALNGITSLSVKPLHLITAMGFIVSLVSMIGVIVTVYQRLMGITAWGWASTVAIICFLGGVQLLSLGVIGEYIGKIYMETKKRPRYIVSERTHEK